MSAIKKIASISVEDYLHDEENRDVKHELINGSIYAMAGASANHERISMNLSVSFATHLKHSPCEPFGSDMKVKAGTNFFYPDVLVDCSFDESEPFYTETPVIIIEILSKSTSQKDRTTKRFAYLNIPTLQEYVLIEQDFVDIEVIRRKDDWSSRHYFLGDKITFESIDLTLEVKDIYARVNNSDIFELINKK